METTRLRAHLARGARQLMQQHFRVRRHEQMLLTYDTATDTGAVEQLMAAALELGAVPSAILIPQLPFQGLLADPHIPQTLAAAAQHCDVWFDLTFPTIAGSHVFDASMKAGRARYLLLGDTAGPGLARLYGGVDLERLFDAQVAADRYFAAAQGKTGRVTTPSGTDLTFTIGKPAAEKTRIADQPGFQTPPGSAMFIPEMESVRGVVMLDAVFHERYCMLSTPLRIEVDGKIRRVEGDAANRRAMDRALRRAGGGEYGYLIHLTYGFHPAACLTGRSFVEDIRVLGANAIGFGLPWWAPGGGENHPDGLIANQSMWIDGEPIIADGVLLNPPELASCMDALEPRIV